MKIDNVAVADFPDSLNDAKTNALMQVKVFLQHISFQIN